MCLERSALGGERGEGRALSWNEKRVICERLPKSMELKSKYLKGQITRQIINGMVVVKKRG